MLKLIALVVLAGVLIGTAIFFLQYRSNNPMIPQIADDATISGNINFNGVPPTGGAVAIYAKAQGEQNFTPIITNLSAGDLVSWSWDDAKTGVNYELVAKLQSNGNTLATSDSLMITAPASGEMLTINYAAKNTPPVPSQVSGSVNINGYIPPGATIILQGRKSADLPFIQVGTSFAATDDTSWSWNDATQGQSYQARAILQSNGVNIGESQAITITAPASDEVLSINSSATPPTPAPTPASQGGNTPAPSSGSAISGSINFNGVAPANSTIVILATPAGQNNYQVVVNGLAPTNGVSWIWNGGTVGTTYQLMAVLKQANSNGTQSDIADSQSIIATAPANNQVFTINSNIQIPGPAGAVTVSCGTKNNSNNTWPAAVSFPTVSGAQGYSFQIGTTNGGNSLVNTILGAQSGENQIVNATFNDSVYYYARYAYTYSPNPNSNTGFSSFSQSYTLQCQL